MLSTFVRLPLCVLLLLLGIVANISAQSSAADIKARLKGKPLYLRGSWRDDNLRFDANGKLIGNSAPISFTLAGFDFTSVKIKPNLIVLNGSRVGTTFTGDIAKRVELGSVRVEIEQPTDGNLTAALDAIFANGLNEMATSLPSYWQGYVTCKLLQKADPSKCSLYVATNTTKSKSNAAKSDKWNSPPRITQQVDAKWNGYAEQLGYRGTTILGLVVKSDGSPSQFAVINPLGLGMDEQALAAVAQYKFAPATKNKNPIASEIEIQVNFDIR